MDSFSVVFFIEDAIDDDGDSNDGNGDALFLSVRLRPTFAAYFFPC